MTSENLLKRVYKTLVDEFDCWKTVTIEMQDSAIVLNDEAQISMCQIQAVINVCKAYELVNKEYTVFCTFTEGKFLVYAYVK